MTKQYKLVKCYPGSPEIGTIVENKNGSIYFPETKTTWSSTSSNYFNSTIVSNPEFWEEIKQEEYTILSIKKVNFKETGIEEWTPEKSFSISLEAMLSIGRSVRSGDYYINSVRRNSDGEIFTVGDMCRSRRHKVRGIINKISIVGGKFLRFSSPCYFLGLENLNKCEFLFTTRDGVDLYKNDNYYTALTGNVSSLNEVVNGPYVADVRDYVSYNIEYFSSKEEAQEFLDSLKPKVLFTAEDGVDIKEGDTIYYIDIDDWSLTERITRKGDTYKDRGLFPFSNLEKAEKYLLLNKPCLSVKEVFDSLDNKVELWKYGRTTSKVIETFKNHVKLKL